MSAAASQAAVPLFVPDKLGTVVEPGGVSVHVLEEVSALEGFLGEDFHKLEDSCDSGIHTCFEMHVFPEENLDECLCSAHVRVQVPYDYPLKSTPVVTVLSLSGLSPKHCDSLRRFLHSKMSGRLGDDLLFEIVLCTQAFLASCNYIGAAEDPVDLSTIGGDSKEVGEEETVEWPMEDSEDEGFDDDGHDSGDDEWDDMRLTLDEDEIIAHSSYASLKAGADEKEEARIRRAKQSAEIMSAADSRTKRKAHFDATKGKQTGDASLSSLLATLKKDIVLEDVLHKDATHPLAMAATDVYELQHCLADDFRAHACQHEGSGNIEVTLAVRLDSFLMKDLKTELTSADDVTKKADIFLQVLGIKPDEFLTVRLLFNQRYATHPEHPKIVSVGRSQPSLTEASKKLLSDRSGMSEAATIGGMDDAKKDECLNKVISAETKIHPFMGSVAVRNRLKNDFFPRQWPAEEVLSKRVSIPMQVYQLMCVTTVAFDVARKLLKKWKSVDMALDQLVGDSPPGGCLKTPSAEGFVSETMGVTEECTDGCEEGEHRELGESPPIISSALTADGSEEKTSASMKKKSAVKKEWEVSDAILAEALSVCTKVGAVRSAEMVPFENAEGLRKCLHCLAPFFAHNALARILFYALYSTLTANERCLVCDLEHAMSETGVRTMVKPSVCNNRLCAYAFMEVGVGFDLASIILHRPEVVDLLITFCYVATASGGVTAFYPTHLRATDKKTGAELSFAKVSRLRKTLEKMPSVHAMIGWCKAGGTPRLKSALSSKSPLLFPLLSWILGTNRAHLRLLRGAAKFGGLPNCHQFEFVSASPEREFRFQKVCNCAAESRSDGKGSVYAWHGSGIGNWHAIARTGLKNMSGTKRMKHGAAFGRGIYMAPRSSTAFWYADAQCSATWPLSMLNMDSHYGRGKGHGLYCLALCQVANHCKLRAPEPFFVVPTAAWVVTRYLFVFNSIDGGYGGSGKRGKGGKGRYFDIAADKLVANYVDKMKQRAATR